MSTGRKWLIIIGGSFLAVVLAGAGFVAWKQHVVKTQETRALQAVNDFLAKDQGDEALAIIQARNRTTGRQTDQQKAQWQSLEIQALSQIGNLPRLLSLYDRAPELFDKEEEASAQVGRATLHAFNFEAYDKLRANWKGKETKASLWFELDVDALLLRGKHDEAVALLKSKTFTGPDDCGRLLRLALVHTPKEMKTAMDYLNQAAKLAPNNPDVRLFRGQILEGAGQLASAQVEYLAAYVAHTNRPYFRDKLADFYRRNGKPDLAVLTWANGLTNAQSTDVIWLHTVFWTKVTRTVKFDFANAKPPFGSLQPFVEYLIALPTGVFWDEAAFTKISEARRYDKELQEIFWLRLLGLLQEGKEVEATKLLEFNPFRDNSWQVGLESTLLRVLAYRKSGELQLPLGVNIPLSTAAPKTRHPLLEQIDANTRDPKQPVPADIQKLLRGKNAFSAVFLSFGWAEAALNLPHDDVIPTDLPDWLPYGLAQATRQNRGGPAALEFIGRQKSQPPLEVLAGEILSGDEKYDEAIRRLTPLTKLDNEIATPAAARISDAHLRLKQFDQARAAVEALPRLRDSVEGKQLIAHTWIAQGKSDEAVKIYRTIENESDEAKSFLARQAFIDKDYARARALSEALLKKHPDNLQFRQNLADIAKAEGAK